jgi:hypothetical protein
VPSVLDAAQDFLVVTDLGRHGFQGMAELVDLDSET